MEEASPEVRARTQRLTGECRRLAGELVDRIIELEADGCELHVKAEGRQYIVTVDSDPPDPGRESGG